VTNATNGNGDTMRLTAYSVPKSVVRRAAQKMRSDGIPESQSSLIRYAIAKLIDMPDDEILDFCIPRPGRKTDPLGYSPQEATNAVV
jgi:hypothetical protein